MRPPSRPVLADHLRPVDREVDRLAQLDVVAEERAVVVHRQVPRSDGARTKKRLLLTPYSRRSPSRSRGRRRRDRCVPRGCGGRRPGSDVNVDHHRRSAASAYGALALSERVPHDGRERFLATTRGCSTGRPTTVGAPTPSADDRAIRRHRREERHRHLRQEVAAATTCFRRTMSVMAVRPGSSQRRRGTTTPATACSESSARAIAAREAVRGNGRAVRELEARPDRERVRLAVPRDLR